MAAAPSAPRLRAAPPAFTDAGIASLELPTQAQLLPDFTITLEFTIELHPAVCSTRSCFLGEPTPAHAAREGAHILGPWSRWAAIPRPSHKSGLCTDPKPTALRRLPRAAPVMAMPPKQPENLRSSPSSSIDFDAAMLSASRKPSHPHEPACLIVVPL